MRSKAQQPQLHAPDIHTKLCLTSVHGRHASWEHWHVCFTGERYCGALRRACSSAPRMTPHKTLQYIKFWQPSGSSTKSVNGLSSRICMHAEFHVMQDRGTLHAIQSTVGRAHQAALSALRIPVRHRRGCVQEHPEAHLPAQTFSLTKYRCSTGLCPVLKLLTRLCHFVHRFPEVPTLASL